MDCFLAERVLLRYEFLIQESYDDHVYTLTESTDLVGLADNIEDQRVLVHQDQQTVFDQSERKMNRADQQ